ncbi:DNA translocase FtsK [Marinobacterium lutimaris]|uniref:DNA translocase FtsK n=1 Tax=Marinobacterium lutimaris TaxID=568106 RepID=A0A1H5UVQ8_9GAMM|nr:DNA translocase FtsK [Marinobacterium lutimaris]SEF79096.1 DNA translocase FtsK [Marinobacterium lutimaris]
MNEKRINSSTALGLQLARVAKEAGLVLLIGLNIFLLLAILSYDPKDPGWSHMGYQGEISNLTGVTGAWIADVAVSLLGVGAYLLPVLFIWPSLRFLRRRGAGLLDAIPFVMLRLSGAILLMIGLTALASMHLSNDQLDYPFTAGGLIGQAVSDLSVAWLSIVGGSVMHWTLLLFGLTLYTEISWKTALEACGGSLLRAWEFVAERLSRRRSAEPEHVDDEEYEQDEPLFKKTPAQSSRAQVQARSAVQPTRADARAEATIRQRTQPLNSEEPTQRERVEPSFSLDGLSARDNDADEPVTDTRVARETRDVEEAGLSQTGETPEIGRATGPVSHPDVSPAAAAVPVSRAAEPAIEQSEEPEIEEEMPPWEAPAQPSPAADLQAGASRKGVKIVPLSESHKPLVDDEPPGNQPSGTTSRKAVPVLPSLDLLDPPELQTDHGYTEDELEDFSRLLEAKLKDFGVVAEVVEVNPGPVITRFELQPAPGVKASKISNLARDLARSMAVAAVRVVEVIPGKSVIGIEIPNSTRQTVRLSEVLNAKPYLEASSRLTLALGNDIAGNPVVANLAKMPHLLVAGTTGSGKSVGVNAMLLSLLFKATPDEVRLMLVDPKMLELSIYDGIPHLLTPVITDMKEAAGGLRWCVAEMERRYRLMAKMGVRNIAGFNEKLIKAQEEGKPLRDPLWNPQEQGLDPSEPAPFLESLPYIVVVVDEFADMMMMVGKKVEELIARIAQKARAAGIHLILATQRPSVDVITGLIKANVPTRIAFQVSSKIDSRTILDQSGAENLLGYGDMLYLPAGTSLPNRVHGAFVSDDEVHRTVEAWKAMGEPVYIDEILSEPGGDGGGGSGNLFDDEADPLYDEAVAFVTETRKASISSVQRKLKIGYNRAARMIESMEAAGVISEAGSNGQREVLAPPPPRD